LLEEMLKRHSALTDSPLAAAILREWRSTAADFWKVEPASFPEGLNPGDTEKLLLEAVRAEASVEPQSLLVEGDSDD
jgi:glutamate synthase domain-containing protein 3